MRFCNTWQTRMDLHRQQHNMATCMQQFQCDLQPLTPKHFTIARTRTQVHPKQLEATVTVMVQEEKRQSERTRDRLIVFQCLHQACNGHLLAFFQVWP